MSKILVMDMNENISRIPETILALIGGVAGILVGALFIHWVLSNIMGVSGFYYSIGFTQDYIFALFGIISLAGGVIGVVSGIIFKNCTKIASILSIIASIICLVGGIISLGIVGFAFLLIAGILGFVRK